MVQHVCCTDGLIRCDVLSRHVLRCAVLCCSGFEGSWVTHPTRWTNQFFRNLLKYDWEVHDGPGGHNQWRPKHKATAPASVKAEPLPEIMSELTIFKLEGVLQPRRGQCLLRLPLLAMVGRWTLMSPFVDSNCVTCIN